MSVVYKEASHETKTFLRSVMEDYFSVLVQLQPAIEIEVLMAYDYKTGVGVKHHGHPCAGKIKLLKAEDRAAERGVYDDDGTPDLRLLLDGERWENLSERQRTALLHHELSHVQVRRNKKDGSLRYDDFGRVKLRLKLDDWMLTGFLETAQIFGEDALEVMSIKAVNKALKTKRTMFDEPVDVEADTPEPKAKAGKKAKDQDVRQAEVA